MRTRRAASGDLAYSMGCVVACLGGDVIDGAAGTIDLFSTAGCLAEIAGCDDAPSAGAGRVVALAIGRERPLPAGWVVPGCAGRVAAPTGCTVGRALGSTFSTGGFFPPGMLGRGGGVTEPLIRRMCFDPCLIFISSLSERMTLKNAELLRRVSSTSRPLVTSNLIEPLKCAPSIWKGTSTGLPGCDVTGWDVGFAVAPFSSTGRDWAIGITGDDVGCSMDFVATGGCGSSGSSIEEWGASVSGPGSNSPIEGDGLAGREEGTGTLDGVGLWSCVVGREVGREVGRDRGPGTGRVVGLYGVVGRGAIG